MTSVSPAGGVRATLLVDEDRGRLIPLLERDPVATVYLRSLVHEFGISPTEEVGHGRFYGFWRGSDLEAVAFVGNAHNMTTLGEPRDMEALMERVLAGPYRPRLFVGPEEHAPVVRRTLFRDGFRPRMDRRQAYYVLTADTLAGLEPLELRPAEPADLEPVVRAHAAMIEEDLGIPLANLDMDRLRQLAERRVERGKIWVHMQGRELVFKTEEISTSGDAILIGGVYTHPRHRGKGFASRGMASWAHRVMRGGPTTLALHVNASNTPAYRAYERAGFRRRGQLRLILTY